MNRRFKVEAPQLFPSKSIDVFFASSFNQNPLQVPEGLCVLVVDVEIDIEPLFIYVKDIRSSFSTNAGNTNVFLQCHECISFISLGIFGSSLMLRLPQGHFAQERKKVAH